MDAHGGKNQRHTTGTGLLVAKLKEAGTHTIIYGFGSVLQTALGFVLIPLYTRYYTPTVYGVLTLVVLVGTIAGSIFYLGISSALARSYYDYDSDVERKVVFSTSLYASLFGALLQTLLGVLLGPTVSRLMFGTSQYAPHIVVALISSAITFVNAVFLMLLRFQRRSIHVIILNLSALILTVGLILYLLVGLHFGVMAPILGTCLGQALLFVALLVLLRGYVVPEWSLNELLVQLRFGIPAVYVGLAYYVLDSVDRFFIQAYGSLHDVGTYSFGYKIGTLIEILLILPFAQIWTPMMMEYRKDRHADQLFRLVLTYYCMIGLFFSVALSVFAKELVHLVAGAAAYFPAYRVVPFVVLGHLAYGATNILGSGILFERKVLYLVYIYSAGLLMNVVLNFAFIPRFGYIAAAYNTLISYVLVAVLAGVVSHRLVKTQWEPVRLGKVIISSVLILVAGSVMHGMEGVVILLTKASFLGLLLVVWNWYVLDGRERRHLRLLFGARDPSSSARSGSIPGN